MHELNIMDKAQLLIKAACGEPYGDGSMVTDICVGYAEPGYGDWRKDGKDVIVFGNWNTRQPYNERDKPATKWQSLPLRLGNALERIGCELEWCDEWTRCGNCYKAMRTVENSYHWRMYGAFVEDDYYCADCLREDMESTLEDYINNPNNALTWGNGSDLEAIGFSKYNQDRYESGWHEGMNDDPKRIYDEIVRWHDDADGELQVVFTIDEHSQFYITFSAYYRVVKSDDYDPDDAEANDPDGPEDISYKFDE